MPSDGIHRTILTLLGARMAGALRLTVILVEHSAVIMDLLDLHGDPGTLAANALASASEHPSRLRHLFFFGKTARYLGVTVLLYELLKPVNKSECPNSARFAVLRAS